MAEQPARIPALDGLRAISVTFVIIDHLLVTKNFTIPAAINPQWLEGLGPLGVRIFFVISGFLITTLLLQELEVKGTIYLPKFYFRRTLRIFLPYYSYLLIVIIFLAIGWAELAPGDIFHAITYTVNYHPERSWKVGHAWSLSVEEQFYLLWPAILLLARKRRGLWIAFAFVALAPVIRLVYYYYYAYVPFFVKYEMGYRFETAADAIGVGCLLAGAQAWFRQQGLYYRILKSKLFILIPILILYTSQLDPALRRSLLFGVSAQNIGIAACIAWSITYYRGKIGRILNSQPMVFLGRMSYSVYLWQELFLDPFSSSIVTIFPLNLVLVAMTSLASYYLIERSSLALRYWLEKRIFVHGRGDQVSDNVPFPAVGGAIPTG